MSQRLGGGGGAGLGFRRVLRKHMFCITRRFGMAFVCCSGVPAFVCARGRAMLFKIATLSCGSKAFASKMFTSRPWQRAEMGRDFSGY